MDKNIRLKWNDLPHDFNDLENDKEIRVLKECDGSCCRDVFLPVSPDELERSFRLWKYKNKNGFMYGIDPPQSLSKNNIIYTDIDIVYPNFKYIRTSRFWYDNEKVPVENGGVVYVYRCSQSCDKDKKCLLERKPEVCRMHPSKGTAYLCEYKNCTLKFEFVDKKLGFYAWYMSLRGMRIRKKRNRNISKHLRRESDEIGINVSHDQ